MSDEYTIPALHHAREEARVESALWQRRARWLEARWAAMSEHVVRAHELLDRSANGTMPPPYAEVNDLIRLADNHAMHFQLAEGWDPGSEP